ncbi:unnamed protein product [Cylicocyclus nassatus]|uniref:Uncharacterized protein n=1 Tax=Cylicocyclus nassatus TaxID=53992 RepID=A0AA36H2D0_CYLNA|nr:unnamed protein product [Cylicocyclus nassatus]
MTGEHSVGAFAARCLLDESQSAELLEEIDENDLMLVTESGSEVSSQYQWMFPASVVVALASLILTWQYIIPTAIATGFLLCAYLARMFAKWRLRKFIRILEELDAAARRANQALLKREMLSFGLGLSKSQALSACRLELFRRCRATVFYVTALADCLVSADFMSEERDRLVSGFYTEEMRELVQSDVNVDSPHVTQRGIGALLDLFVLHRSEVLRLLVLYLHRSSALLSLKLVLRIIFVLIYDISGHVTRLNAFTNTVLHERTKTNKLHPAEAAKIGGLDEVAVMLDEIITKIASKNASADEVRTALQRVLSMRIFNATAKTLNDEKVDEMDDGSTEKEYGARPNAVLRELAPPRPLRDEVFEVIASSEGNEGKIMSFEDEVLHQNPELMDELHRALEGRASEFAARERRALAAFYGVTDAELDELEEAQNCCEDDEDDVQGKEETSSTVYESSDHNYQPDNRMTSDDTTENPPSRALPADLLAALRMRSSGAEQVIGDDDDDDD